MCDLHQGRLDAASIAQAPLERNGRAYCPRVVSILWSVPRDDMFRSDEKRLSLREME